MIKNIEGYRLSTQDCRVVVKSFSGATTVCMTDYIKSSLKHKPDTIILHCGTNNLKTKDSKTICSNILDLAKFMTSSNEDTGIIVSGIVPRDDELNPKAMEVNKMLMTACNERNIGFINNNNIDPRSHLNKSRLHLIAKVLQN